MPAESTIGERELVLVASSDRELRERAREVLEEAALAVAEVSTWSDAHGAIEILRPSLILVDFEALEQEGFTLLGGEAGLGGLHPLPVVVVGCPDDPASFRRVAGVGATHFLDRPVRWALLGRRVHFALDSSRASSELRSVRETLTSVQRIAHLGSWEWDPKTDRMRWSDETYRILGVQPDDVKPTLESFLNCVHPGDLEFVKTQFEDLQLVEGLSVEHRITVGDQEVRHIHIRAEVTTQGRSGRTRVTGTVQDVTDQRRAQERIRYLANYDSLSGLANRHRFKERLEEAIEEARARDHFVGLLYMDLDQFKRINDTLGHSAGDRLLQAVADLLRRQVRRMDVVGRIEGTDRDPEISRLGGDEFTILLRKVASPESAGDVARRILRELPTPIVIDDHEVSTTGSIGIAIYPLDGQDAETLVKHADRAMYHAKESGRNNLSFFDESMNISSIRKMSLESALRTAVERDELQVLYQPRVDLRTGLVTAVEALARWQHPELGVVSPKEFIPVAEETGLIVSIGQRILERACAQAKRWQKEGYDRLRLSVNVSSRQFAHHDLRANVAGALRRSGLDPRYLELEITESTMLQDDEETAIALRDLKAMGVRFALDDFGTGYSSLSYLTRFPLDALKLDRSIVRDVDTDPAAAGITTAVIAMAHSLNLRVIAEGVDTDEQAHFLRDKDCDEIQGFFFAGPVGVQEFVRFLSKKGGPRGQRLRLAPR